MRAKHFCFRTLFCLLVVGLCEACDERTLVHKAHLMPEAGWARGDTIELQACLNDSLLQADLYIEVRHRFHYPYRNLPVAFRVLPPDSLLLPPEQVNLLLADSQGTWKGQGLNLLHQVTEKARSIAIRRPGLYRFQLWHLLPDSLLPDVNDVAIRLQRPNQTLAPNEAK